MVEDPLAVSTRELSRCAAALLDEVAGRGRTVVISRYGRPIAVLGPIPESDRERFGRLIPGHAPPRYLKTDSDPEEDELLPQEIALNDIQRSAFDAVVAAAPFRWSASSQGELSGRMVPMFELEMKGLIEGYSFHYALTHRGQRLADALSQTRGAAR